MFHTCKIDVNICHYKCDPHPPPDEYIAHTTCMGYLHHIHNLNRMHLKYSFILICFQNIGPAYKLCQFGHVTSTQLVDSYIYLKLPEIYVTKTRGFVFNVAHTIDCIENHGCNEAITCTTLWDKDIKKTVYKKLQVTMIVRFCYVY